MADLYFLSFRDISSSSTAVTAGELYRLPVDANTNWVTAVLSGGNWVSWEQVPNVFRGKRVCFVLHGFNVSSQAGQKSCGPLAQSCKDLGDFALDMTGADIVVPVLWPGDGFIGWSYFTAFNHAEAAGQKFADFLTSSAFTGAEVSFISHSLGARVVLETVTQAIAQNMRASFNTAILMAPAVDETALDDPKFAAASGSSGLRRIVVLSSVKDQILQYWFAIGDAVETAMWWDYKSDSRALGRFGPVFQDDSAAKSKTEWYAITPSDDPARSQDHGDYLPAGGPPPTQGWTDKPERVGFFCSDVMNRAPFHQPQLAKWASDNTGQFRSGWKAGF